MALENLDLPDFLEHQGPKVTWVLLDQKEVQVFKAQEVRKFLIHEKI